jgi:hypothetical protein
MPDDLSWWTEGEVDDEVRKDVDRQLALIDALQPAKQLELDLQRVVRCDRCHAAVIRIANLKLFNGNGVQVMRVRPPRKFPIDPDVPLDDPKAVAKAIASRKQSYRREPWSPPAIFIDGGQYAAAVFSAACECWTYPYLSVAKALSGELTFLSGRPDTPKDDPA